MLRTIEIKSACMVVRKKLTKLGQEVHKLRERETNGLKELECVRLELQGQEAAAQQRLLCLIAAQRESLEEKRLQCEALHGMSAGSEAESSEDSDSDSESQSDSDYM